MALKDILRLTENCAAIRCGDDVVRIGSARGRYAIAARAVEALEPATAELLDAEGNVLRVVQLAEEAEEDEQEAAGRSVSDLSTLAKVIGDVSDRAAQRHAQAYEQAFQAQTELVRLIADRLNSLEKAWHKTILMEYQRAADEAAQNDAQESSVLDGAFGEVIRLASAGKKD